MTINAINGSAINKTAFPGSEEGLSLIELIGLVEVTGSIAAVNLRLSAFATTTAQAAGEAQSVKRSNLPANTTPAAAAFAYAYIKRPASAVQPAVCTPAAGIRILHIQAASSIGTAVAQPAYGYVAAKNAGSVACNAGAQLASARSLAPRAAITASTAAGFAAALRKTQCAASLKATAAGVAAIVFKSQLPASAQPTAAGSVICRTNIRRSASTVSVATVSATALRKLVLSYVVRKAEAKCAAITVRRKISLNVAMQANASASARIRTKYMLSASVAATATAQTTALDFASAMPAPAERLMTVQASDRRMGVTE